MSVLDFIFLSVLQGIAEFLPISSSGHLFLLKYLLNMQEIPVTFDILLHFASLLAILLIYFKDILKMLKDSYLYLIGKGEDEERYSIRVLFGLVISTLITVVVYVVFKLAKLDEINNIKVIGVFFIVTASMLIVSKFITPNTDKITLFSIIVSGFFQGIGILPGISRSGSSIFGSLLCRVSLEESARYSFLLAIPAILGAFVLSIPDLQVINIAPSILAISFVTCFVVSFISMKVLVRLIQKGSYYLFAPYLILLGISCFFLKPF